MVNSLWKKKGKFLLVILPHFFKGKKIADNHYNRKRKCSDRFPVGIFEF